MFKTRDNIRNKLALPKKKCRIIIQNGLINICSDKECLNMKNI